MNTDENIPWLERPSTLRGLWIGGGIVLALSVIAGFFFPPRAVLGWDDWPGFAAVFGFGACVAMVVVAKGLGVVLKRDERYYAAETSDSPEDPRRAEGHDV